MGRFLRILSFTLGLALFAPTAALATTYDELVSQYGTALRNGDVDTLNALTAGKLKSKRQRLWSNPNYPQFLMDSYAELSVRVVAVGSSPVGTTLDVEFTTADSTVIKRLTLDESSAELQIVGERVLAD